MGQKEGGATVLLSRGAGTPSNTMWPGPRWEVPSGVFIHQTVWPQRTLAENWEVVPL